MIEKVLDRRYRIIGNLSQGGFGQTYLARDVKRPNNPICVVKQLKPKNCNLEVLSKARELFDREANILEKLGEHPQIPRLLAYFQEDNEFYLIQEYIEGQTLAEELEQSRILSTEKVIVVVRELLTILQFVHQNRVIHRDIAPKNIIRRQQDRKLVLIDFGAVKEINNLGQVGTTIGSLGYSPPEQLNGRAGYYSDLFAVGIIAIQALTGINPNPNFPEGGFSIDKSGEIAWRHLVRVDESLTGFLDKMVRQNKQERYQTATEALNALKLVNRDRATVSTVGNLSSKTNNIVTSPVKKNKYLLRLSLLFPLVIFLLVIVKIFGDRNTLSYSRIPVNGKAIESTLEEEKVCSNIIEREDLFCETYVFTADRGQTATIEINSNDFDPFLILQKPDGSKLAVNGDISTANWNAKIVVDLDRNGEYTIVARTTVAGESGKYSIRAIVK